MQWLFLSIAILCETIGTMALKQSDGFRILTPSIVVVISYGVAFYFLSLTLKYIPVGIAYAIWAGVGIVLIALFGYFLFRQALDTPAIMGMSLIIAGVVVINVFSKSVGH